VRNKKKSARRNRWQQIKSYQLSVVSQKRWWVRQSLPVLQVGNNKKRPMTGNNYEKSKL
jgi:hypothetical protein